MIAAAVIGYAVIFWIEFNDYKNPFSYDKYMTLYGYGSMEPNAEKMPKYPIWGLVLSIISLIASIFTPTYDREDFNFRSQSELLNEIFINIFVCVFYMFILISILTIYGDIKSTIKGLDHIRYLIAMPLEKRKTYREYNVMSYNKNIDALRKLYVDEKDLNRLNDDYDDTKELQRHYEYCRNHIKRYIYRAIPLTFYTIWQIHFLLSGRALYLIMAYLLK